MNSVESSRTPTADHRAGQGREGYLGSIGVVFKLWGEETIGSRRIHEWKIVHRHADPITEARAASSVVANH